MSYRSFKRALGETNIERKCRILFGICFGVLVCGAFFGIDRITTGLANRTDQQKLRGYAANALYAVHWKYFDKEAGDYADQMMHDLQPQDFEVAVLSLDDDVVRRMDDPEKPTDQKERDLLERLREVWLLRRAERDESAELDPEATSEVADLGLDFRDKNDPIFETKLIPEQDRYLYYQPVSWNGRCVVCHVKKQDGTFSLADTAMEFPEASQPFRVVRVSMPYGDSQDAITWTRAILLATAISMIFLAMVALYLIVRYVIVKPLTHLSEVSEEVSQGNLQLRADIQTNDEFEGLATSFNRMLQHLTDAQDKLTNVNSDLDAKVDELAQLNMRLYEMNLLKSDFLANMSHELRTPLNSIIGFSEVLQGIDSLTDKQKRYAHNIQKSGRVLLEMINDILDLAKLEAGKMELKPTEFPIDVVVNAQCDMVRPLCEDKNIDLEVQSVTDGSSVYQDQSKIQQILTNLLSNAIKFTPEGGRIRVIAERMDTDQLRVSVADTGVGIPEEDSEVIFEKFRQSKAVLDNDGLTREFSGTGLGLSIVKELCKLLGGEISFESELGKGSTFAVTVPWTLVGVTSFSRKVSQQIDKMSHPNPNSSQTPPPAGDAAITTADI